jgi:hypothetical protein
LATLDTLKSLYSKYSDALPLVQLGGDLGGLAPSKYILALPNNNNLSIINSEHLRYITIIKTELFKNILYKHKILKFIL